MGNMGSKLMIFLLLPLYTNYLQKSEYGYYDILLTIAMLVESIFTLRIPDAMYRWLLDKKEDENFIISTCVDLLKKLILIFSFTYLLFYRWLNEGFVMVYFYLLTTILVAFSQQIIRGKQKNALFSILGTVETFVFLSLNILLIVVMKYKIEGILISKIISNMTWVIFGIKEIKFSGKVDKIRSTDLKKKMLKYSLPLLPNVLSWWIMKVSDRYAIGIFLGTEWNGIYAVSNKFPALLMVFNTIFLMAWQESSFTEYGQKDYRDFYSRTFNELMKFQFLTALMIMPISRIFTELFIGEDFQIAWRYSLLLIFSNVFFSFSSFLGTIYLTKKKTKGTFLSSGVGAGLNLLINILFIKKYGLSVAAISTFVSFVVMYILRAVDTKKYIQLDVNVKELVLFTAYSLFNVFMITVLASQYVYAIFCVNFILFIYFNRKLLFKMLSKLKVDGGVVNVKLKKNF